MSRLPLRCMNKKRILAICGSTRMASVNLHVINYIASLTGDELDIEVYEDLVNLPQFNPDIDTEEKLPAIIAGFRNKVQQADGILICTPEYVFTLPGSLKNALEWTVSTTVFSDKPAALITASGMGAKAHEALQLVMKTIQTVFTDETQLLISGAKSKISKDGTLQDPETETKLRKLAAAFVHLVKAEA